MKNFKLSLLAAALLSVTSNSAFSAVVSDVVDVSATVNSVCVITTNNLAFGAYNPLSSAATDLNTETVDVTCTLNTPHQVVIDVGSGTSVTARSMGITTGTSGARLNYSLACSSAGIDPAAQPVSTGCATNWGLAQGTESMSLVGTGVEVQIPVLATIPALQNVPIGNYQDQIGVQVFF